jgi:hypothetical protein
MSLPESSIGEVFPDIKNAEITAAFAAAAAHSHSIGELIFEDWHVMLDAEDNGDGGVYAERALIVEIFQDGAGVGCAQREGGQVC